MAQISSTVGLNSGVDIAGLVDSLIEISARPRDALLERNEALEAEQTAIEEVAAALQSVQSIVTSLGKTDLYTQRDVSSSNSRVLSATVSDGAETGSYQFTVLQTADYQQYVSGSGYSSTTSKVGAGTFTFRFGDNVQRAADLGELNGGQGVSRGSIRITDRSGESATVDLSAAQDIDDVIDAINNCVDINVTAEADGDHLRLTDNTGQTTSNLKVQEVAHGTTAASLGLAGIDAAAATANGADIVALSADTDLNTLNDGNGVQVSTVLSDITYTLRDGTTGTIDFSKLASGATADYQQDETTLGDVLDVINAANPSKLHAEIAADGKRLVVTDLTAGAGAFSLAAKNDSSALEDLGLTGAAVGGVITGERIVGGLKTVLLSSLNGGQGLGALGSLTLTDRNGASATVDLSNAETLEDVIDTINAAGVDITASVNDAKTGILLTDSSGLASGSMTVANADATGTVFHLGLASSSETTSVSTTTSSLDTGDLHLQVVSAITRLSALNGNSGVAKGKFTIYDSDGDSTIVDLTGSSISTIGDLVRTINQGLANVQAEINETGDGITLVDLAGGTGTLTVREGDSTTAADLHLLGGATTKTVDGESVQVIDGTTTVSVTTDENVTLTELVTVINSLGAGVSAGVFSDGSTRPYRLLLTSDGTGEAAQMVVDVSQAGFTLQETSHAQDGLLTLGSSGATGLYVTSANNKYENLIAGVSLTAVAASASAVTITVSNGDSDLVSTVESFVEKYNSFRELLADDTAYDAEADTRAALFGSSVALRLDIDVAHALTSRYGSGTVKTLAQLGIAMGDDGTLTLDSSTLTSLYDEDPEGVQKFFTTADSGFCDVFEALAEQLAGETNSLTSRQADSLGKKITNNEERVDYMNERLKTEQSRLLMQFYNMDLAIGKMQKQLKYIDQLYAITSADSSAGSSSSGSSSSSYSLGSLASGS